MLYLPLSTRDSFASIAENRCFILVREGQFFVPHCPFGGQPRDKNTEKICKYTENKKKKRKSVFLYYPLIYSKLVLYFFSFYAFLFFGLFPHAEMLKYIPKHFICSDFATYNFCQMEETFSQILADEITRKIYFHTFKNPDDGFFSPT